MRLELEQEDLGSYKRAADFLNLNGNDLVCMHHEYGIYGGVARRDSRERHQKRMMAMIVSGVFGLLSVYVILSHRYDAQTLFADTTIGAITGYWLKN